MRDRNKSLVFYIALVQSNSFVDDLVVETYMRYIMVVTGDAVIFCLLNGIYVSSGTGIASRYPSPRMNPENFDPPLYRFMTTLIG